MTETAPVMGAVLYYSIDFMKKKGLRPRAKRRSPRVYLAR
jgi:hypothetical protein